MVQQERHFSVWMPTYVALSVIALLVIVMSAAGQDRARSWVADDGLIQQLTAVVLFAGCLMCLQRALRKIQPAFKWLELSFLLLIYTMREMDLHRLLTQEHLSRMDFYTGPYPLYQKAIALPIVLLTIAALAHFTLANARFFFEQLKKKQSWAIHVVVWAILLFGAQILDKSRWHRHILEAIVEETMEFTAAIVIFLILIRYPVSRNRVPEAAQPVEGE